MPMRYLLILLTMLTAAARADDTKPFNPADYPPAVQKALRDAHKECESQGGGLGESGRGGGKERGCNETAAGEHGSSLR